MLVRILLRICLQEALRGRTLAGDNILDSNFSAVSFDDAGQLKTDQDQPFICVYTDGSKSSGAGLRGLLNGGDTQVVIEAAISSSMAVVDPETGASVTEVGLPDTDAALELQLDFLVHQIFSAVTADDNEWGKLATSLLLDTPTFERSRIASAAGGARIAGHELRLTVRLIDDPICNDDLSDSSFAKVLQQLGAGTNTTHIRLAELISEHLSGTLVDYQRVQRLAGHSAETTSALGLGPLVPLTSGDLPELAGIKIEVRDD